MEINEEVQKILDEPVIDKPLPTCSISNIKPYSIAFCRAANIIIAFPVERERTTFIHVDNAEWTFWNYHNWYWKDLDTSFNSYFYNDVNLHDTAVIGHVGVGRIKYNGKYIDPIHIGGVLIGEGTRVGAHSVIQRGTLDNTVIGRNVEIGALNNVGHNCIIGDDVVITENVSIGGSATIRDRCYIGLGAIIRDGITICEDAYIGMGSVVTKSITEKGIWYGSPAKLKV